MSIRLYARLVANSTTDTELGCWRWSAQLDRGYGRLTQRIDGRHVKPRAHRVMEQLIRQNAAQFAADDAVPGLRLAPTVPRLELDPDETLDHVCACRACINPDHWEPVSGAENARRQQALRPSGWWGRRAA